MVRPAPPRNRLSYARVFLSLRLGDRASRTQSIRRWATSSSEDEVRIPRDNRGSMRNYQRMDMDDDACYRAIETRDHRFDGRLFIAVTTTRICRPVCPAPTPKRGHVRFFSTAAGAQEAGFRPCLRCRPETSPELAFWRGSSNTLSRALGLIEAGALDDANVETLTVRLGIGERQLRRLFRQYLGASAISIAQTRRILLAKQSIQHATADDGGCLGSRLRKRSAIQRDLSTAISAAAQGTPADGGSGEAR
jgi:methylphosphotriester-DNA--protein-cysteine methyltransferase